MPKPITFWDKDEAKKKRPVTSVSVEQYLKEKQAEEEKRHRQRQAEGPLGRPTVYEDSV